MAATISDVRLQIGDTETPYLFEDPMIQDALDEASDLLQRDGISVDSTSGKRAHKLLASIYLVNSFLGRIKNRAVKSIREGDVSIDYVDLQNQVEKWKTELEEIRTRLQDPLEAVYDNY
jgi:hypothetical protein